MPSATNDLLQLFQAISLYNDQKAFEQLFRLQFEKLHCFAKQYVDTAEMAEEVVNDVFVKIWKYRSHLHTISNPESYLFIAVKNGSLNYIKQYSKLRISVNSETSLSSLVSSDSPQQSMEWKEMNFKLNTAVDELPDQCRKIFKLVKEEGLKPRQVAQILNISVRTVETQLYRAMKRLDEVLLRHKNKRKKNTGSHFNDGSTLFLLCISALFL